MRTGVVLSEEGGALKPVLPLFKLGLGGRLGSGKQWWSWIHIDDMVGAMLHILNNPRLSGPVNMVGPDPVTNSEFTKMLGKVLRRPAIFPAPAFALRLVMGQMAEEVLLGSQRVEPRVLLASGYNFRFRDLEGALKNLVG